MTRIILLMCILYTSCNVPSNSIVITQEDNNDIRPMFTVKLPNGRTYTHFYAEEIAHALVTDKWINNEDLRLSYASEYQVNLEPDSIMIYDYSRKVAAVPYEKAGILDSIFIKDNE